LPKFPQTCPKSVCETFAYKFFPHKDRENIFGVTSKKGLLVFFCKRWAPFFEVKQRWAPFFEVKQRWAPFLEVKQRWAPFCPDFQGFCSDFQDFYRIFTFQ